MARKQPDKRNRSVRRKSTYDVVVSQVRGATAKSRTATIDALEIARHRLPAAQFPRFMSWLLKFPQARRKLFAPSKVIDYKDLTLRTVIPAANLGLEINWWSSLIAANDNRVAGFLLAKDEIGTLVSVGSFGTALSVLDEFEAEFGHSLWGIQLRIALLEQQGEIEERKALISDIAKVAPNTMAAYVAYHASNRNSDACSSSLFVDQFQQSLESQQIAPHFKKFIDYQLTGRVPNHPEELSELLSVAGTVSIPDLTETLLDSVHSIVANKQFDYFEIAGAAINRFDYSGDSAYRMLRYVTSSSDNSEDFEVKRDLDLLATLNGVDPGQGIDQLASQPLKNFGNIKFAASILAAKNISLGETRALQIRALSSMIAVYELGERLLVAIDDIRDIAMNFKGVSIGRYMRAIVPKYNQPLFFSGNEQLLASTEIDPIHVEYFRSEWQCNDEISIVDAKPNITETDIGPFTRFEEGSAKLHSFESASTFIELCDNLSQERSSTEFNNYVLRAKCVALAEEGRTEEFIDLAANVCTENQVVKYVLPIVEAVFGKPWDFWLSRVGELSSPVIVSLGLSLVEDNTSRDLLRDLTDEFLDASDCPYPHQLLDKHEEIDRKQALYFLREICVPPVLDVCLQFSGTRALLEERIKVCSLLAKVDAESKAAYEEEVKSITRANRIDTAISTLDKSRVYVDESPLRRLCNRKYGVLFDSYKKLREGMDERESDAFIKALVAVLTEERPIAKGQFELPPDIATEVLKNLVGSLKDEFLNNSEYGLDSYLSMRIRHGTLSGTLSRPLRESGVLAVEVADGKFSLSEETTLRLRYLEDDNRTKVLGILVELTQNFDKAVGDIKGKFLQIKSDVNPSGLFELPVDSMILKSMVADIEDDWSFDDFFSLSFQVFWQLLQISLKRVQDRLQQELKGEVVAAIDKARDEIAAILIYNTEERTSVSAALNTARTQIQYEIDRVAGWFIPPENPSLKISYSIDEIIDISLESVKNLHPGFRPKLAKDVRLETTEVLSQALLILTDVFFNILDNVHNHSESTSPQVSLIVEGNSDSNIMTIVAENEIDFEPTSLQIKELELLRSELTDSFSDKVIKSEGRSGMHKLRRLASKSGDTPVRFEYREEGTFHVEVDLDYYEKTLPGVPGA